MDEVFKALADEAPSTVIFKIERTAAGGDVVQLTITHQDFASRKMHDRHDFGKAGGDVLRIGSSRAFPAIIPVLSIFP